MGWSDRSLTNFVWAHSWDGVAGRPVETGLSFHSWDRWTFLSKCLNFFQHSGLIVASRGWKQEVQALKIAWHQLCHVLLVKKLLDNPRFEEWGNGLSVWTGGIAKWHSKWGWTKKKAWFIGGHYFVYNNFWVFYYHAVLTVSTLSKFSITTRYSYPKIQRIVYVLIWILWVFGGYLPIISQMLTLWKIITCNSYLPGLFPRSQ